MIVKTDLTHEAAYHGAPAEAGFALAQPARLSLALGLTHAPSLRPTHAIQARRTPPQRPQSRGPLSSRSA